MEVSPAILQAIEGSLLAYAEAPQFEWLSIPGVQARALRGSQHPLFNIVGVAQCSAEDAAATLAQALAVYAEMGELFGFCVGPLSQPTDWAARLQAAGFTLAVATAGMVRTDLQTPIRHNPAVRVRRATREDIPDLCRVYSEGYPIPANTAAPFLEWVWALGGHHYLAWLEGMAEPVTAANLFPFPGSKILVLQGAATLPDYRGRGLYTSILAQRIADAAEMGMEAAILQADRSSSAPICARLGFTEITSLDVYLSPPPPA
ncbi:MAG: GNAT family N-acetyltransferase [Anaerolineaceae bacterium]|nr:GNAT family N-acetyltransferase [Anaerolineaceae bacterium]